MAQEDSSWKGTLILGSSSEHKETLNSGRPTPKTNFRLLPFLYKDPIELSTGGRETCSTLSSQSLLAHWSPIGVGKKILFMFFISENQ